MASGTGKPTWVNAESSKRILHMNQEGGRLCKFAAVVDDLAVSLTGAFDSQIIIGCQ
jgi:hypothetical protein